MKKTVIIIISIIAIVAIILVGFLLLKPKNEPQKELKLQSTEEIQNMLNTEFYEDFSNWIEENNFNGILPNIEGIETIECLSTGYAYQTGIDTARYQIQLRITYYK